MNKSIVAATSIALLNLVALNAAHAQAAGGVTVSVSGGTISVVAQGSIPPGDLVIQSSADRMVVFPDPESKSALSISAGAGCTASGTLITCTSNGSNFAGITISLMLAAFETGPLSVAISPDTAVPTTFFGSFDRDVFYGGSGADTILGYGGDDSLFGGRGDDAIFGGDGRDFIDGEEGSDTVYGDAQADLIVVDDDGRAIDWVNCNNYVPGATGTNNDPRNPPANTVFFDLGVDRITDCGSPGTPAVTKPASLTGTPTVGKNYVANSGTYTGEGLTMSYTWFSCPNAEATIPVTEGDPPGICTQLWARDGAPGLTYKPRSSDKGQFLKLRVTARNNSGFVTHVTNASLAVVLPRR